MTKPKPKLRCPWCRGAIDPRKIPDEVLASERGRRNAGKRQTIGKSTGRKPVSERCPCQMMSAGRAKARGHVCGA